MRRKGAISEIFGTIPPYIWGLAAIACAAAFIYWFIAGGSDYLRNLFSVVIAVINPFQ